MSEEKRFGATEWITVLLVALASFYLGDHLGRNSIGTAEFIRDTVITIQTDTLFREKPVYVDRVEVRTERIEVRDTVRLHDTLFVEVPVEQVVYADSLYRAWVSGIHPALDSIEIYAPTRIVEVSTVIREKPPSWGIGITAGYGASVVDKSVRLTPFLGVGITYNILHW